MTENIAGVCACRMCIGFSLRHNVQFVVERYSVDSRKTQQNGSVDANRSMRC